MYKSIKPFVLLMIILSSPAWSLDAAQLKKQALEACETSVQQVPEAYRNQSLKTCKCAVEKTDYDAVIAGNTSKVQEDALKNAQLCAKEAGTM